MGVEETRVVRYLHRVADVREELLATLTALADFSYGWGLLDAYLPRLQAAVSTPHPNNHNQMLRE